MMASSMVKLISETFLNANYKYTSPFIIKRHSSKFKKPRPRTGTIKHRNLIASSCESLAARGFLRSYKPYNPKENVRDIVFGICNKVLGTSFDLNLNLSREDKFALLNTCFEELNHSVPNSQLHKINCVNDVVEFYETPVSTTVPYDEFKNLDLPPNLHIQYDYVRFDPATDTKFKGVSAYPGSSTIVTGIKYKEKYRGHETESPFKETKAEVQKKFSLWD